MGRVTVLDDPLALSERDPSGALSAIASLPDQIAAWSDAEPDGAPARPRTALVCGMGGSGVAADLAAVLATNGPVAAHHGYGAPAWCGPDSFVVASSYSGGTAETLSALRAAAAAGASGCAVASGGPLLDEARVVGWDVHEVPTGTMPRYAIGHLTLATLAPLAHLDPPFVEPFAQHADEAAGLLKRRLDDWGPDRPATDNEAKTIAESLVGTLPVVWGGPGITGVAAGRWRTDLNENAKVLAHSAVVPELDHNEIVGLGADGREQRPDIPIVLVCLRDAEADEDRAVAARFAATLEEVAPSVRSVIDVRPSSGHPLARFFELTMLSGFVSGYLGLLRGVDPAPITSIDRLKQSLSGR